jgi:tocopherol cyclase
MEGYYWRVVAPGRGEVVVAICGVLAPPAGGGAIVALGAAGRGVRTRIAPRVTAAVREERRWDRALGGLGLAHLLPGLGQYWHPHTLGARVSGRLDLAGERVELDDALLYAEKNWGPAFPRAWWWGQASGLGGADACVAFAGGRLEAGPLAAPATAVVLALEGRTVRLVPPFAWTRASADGRRWSIRARGPRVSLELEGEAGEGAPLPLPVPPRRAGDPAGVVAQHARARIAVRLRRGRRLLFAGATELGGLELGGSGTPAGAPLR